MLAFFALVILASVFVASGLVAKAAINQEINYQGKLTAPTGIAVADNTYNMEFKLYTTATGGAAIWTEDDLVSAGNGPYVKGGLFSLMLGSTTAFTGVNFNQTLYLGVNIGGTTTSPVWDGEMTPRKILGAVPAAFVAQTLNGLSSSEFLRSDAANSTSSASTFFSITNSGTGDIADFIGQNSKPVLYVQSGGNVGIGTSSPYLALSVQGASILGNSATAGFFVGTTTATSTLTGGLQTSALNVTSATASSTFADGINLAAGCFAVGGTCLTSGSGSGTVNSGLSGQATFYGANGSTVSGTSTLVFGTSTIDANNIGIGTSTPYAKLSVSTPGQAIATSALFAVASTTNATLFNVLANGNVGIGTTSPGSIFSIAGVANFTTATSTLYSAGGVNISGGCYAVKGTCQGTVGSGSAGQLAYYAAGGSVLSGSSLLNLSGSYFGIGTTAPANELEVDGGNVGFDFEPSTPDVENSATGASASQGGAGSYLENFGVLNYDIYAEYLDPTSLTTYYAPADSTSFNTATASGDGFAVNVSWSAPAGALNDGNYIVIVSGGTSVDACPSAYCYYDVSSTNVTDDEASYTQSSVNPITQIGYSVPGKSGFTYNHTTGAVNTLYNTLDNGAGGTTLLGALSADAGNFSVGSSSMSLLNFSDLSSDPQFVITKELSEYTSDIPAFIIQDTHGVTPFAALELIPNTGSGWLSTGGMEINMSSQLNGASNIQFGSGRGLGVNSNSLVMTTGNSGNSATARFQLTSGAASTYAIFSNDSVGIGTSTPWATLSVNGNSDLGNSALAGFFIGTSTATSTLVGGLQLKALNVTSSTASSTFADGINLSAGCFAIKNTCVGGSGGSGTVNNGLPGQVAFYGLNGAAVSGTSTLVFGTSTVDANNIGIGTSTPWAVLSLASSAAIPGGTNSIFAVASSSNATLFNILGNGDVTIPAGTPNLVSATTSGMSAPNSVAIAGRYAYVADGVSLSVFDLSNPASPAKIASTTASGQLVNPTSVYVSGRYAYVQDAQAGFFVFDISNPAIPTLVGANFNIFPPNTSNSVVVAGRYAYALDGTALDVIDVSNPASPVLVGSKSVTGSFPIPQSIAVSGRYAYVEDEANGLSIFDISNPVSPVIVKGPITDELNASPRSVYVSGRYAYVADPGTPQILAVFDVSNPNVPVEIATTSTGLSGPIFVTVSGRYAYVTDITNGLVTFDVSNPAIPKEVSATKAGLSSPQFVTVSGRYAYVVDASKGLVTFDLGGDDVNAENVGSLEAGTLQVRNDITAGGQLTVGGGLNVGTGGIFSAGPISIGIASSTQASAVSAFFQGNVGIGTTSPWTNLSVKGTSDLGNSALAGFFIGTSTATSTFGGALSSASGNFIVSSAGTSNNLLLDPYGGNVGIGTSTPNWNLQVAGKSPVIALTDINAAKNQQQWYLENQSGSFYIGTSSNALSATSSYLIFDNRSNHSNTGVGYTALGADTTGSANTALGYQAGSALTSATDETFVGYEAGIATTNNTAQQNTFVGYEAGLDNTTGQFNTLIGSSAIGAATGNFNTIIGAQAGFGFNTAGSNSNNVIIGYNAVGGAASAATGNDTIVGYQAAYTLGSGTNNTVFGYQTGYGLSTGASNIFLGYQTASTTASGKNNIALGYNINLPSANGSNQLDIGNIIYGTGVTGSMTTTAGNIGIASTTPWATLSVEPASASTSTNPLFAVASTTNATLFDVLGNGNIGAGTTTPYAQLSLAGSAVGTPTFALSPIANQTADIQDIYTTAGKLADVITAANTFGIGTTSPWATLSVSTTSQQSGLLPLFAVASTSNATLFDVLGNGDVNIPAGNPNMVSASTAGGLSSANSAYVSGRYLYVTDAQSLSIFDDSNPASPALIASTTTGLNSPRSVYVSGRYAYVTSYNNHSLVIFDISNPSRPTQLGSSNTGLSQPYSVYVVGRYAYVTDQGNSSVVVFDVSNPANPVKVGVNSGNVSTPYDIVVSGRYAYVADSSNGLVTFDISNSASPTFASSTVTGLSSTAFVYVSGRYAYVASSGNNSVVVFDISNPSAPNEIGSVNGLSGPAYIYVSGRYAYVLNSINNTVAVLDISNPTAPVKVGTLALGVPKSITVSGHYAYVTDTTLGLVTLDLGGADINAENVGSLEAGNLQVRNDLTAGGQVSIGGGLNVGTGGIFSAGPISVGIASSTQSNPVSAFFQGSVAIGTTTPWGTLSVEPAVAGTSTNPIFALASSTNATLFDVLGNGDVNIPAGTPNFVSATTSGMFTANYIAVSGRYAYVLDSKSLTVFDVSNPNLPTKIASTTNDLNTPESIVVSGRYAYVADNANGLVIFDISNPASPSLASSTTDGLTTPHSIYVSGRYAYVANSSGNRNLVVFDISNPYAPMKVGLTPVFGTMFSGPLSLTVSGRYAYVTDAKGLVIVDLANTIASPSLASSTTAGLGSLPESVYVSGRYAYVADFNNGLIIFDISNPTAPIEVAATTAGLTHSFWVTVSGRYAYVGDTGGFVTFDVSNPAAPVEVSATTAGLSNNNKSISVSGHYAYIADPTKGLVIFDLGGAEVNGENVGSLEAGTLQVRNDITAGGQLTVGGGLSVGNGGIFSAGPISVGVSSSTQSGAISAFFQGNVGIGTTSPYANLSVVGSSDLGNSALAGYFVGTTTATSTLAGGLQTVALNVTSTTATSTFAEGLSLSNGCVAVKGVCSTVNSGTAGQTAYYAGIGNAVTGTSTLKINTNQTVTITSNLGISDTSNALLVQDVAVPLLRVQNNKVVATNNSTLDDGSGNMSILHNIVAGGTLVSQNNTLDDGSGNATIAGNIGIGCSSNTNAMHLCSGTGTNDGALIEFDATPSGGGTGGGNDWLMQSTAGTASQGQGYYVLYDYTSSTQGLQIDPSGNVTVGNNLTVPGISGSNYCVYVDSSGQLHNTGSSCSTAVGTINVGTGGQIAYYPSSTQTISSSGDIVLSGSNVGITSSSTPWGNLSVKATAGNSTPEFVVASTTNAVNFLVNWNGNVGIGTTSPFANLSVASGAVPGGANTVFAVASSSNVSLFNILGNGNVGIGTTSAYAQFSVVNDSVNNPAFALVPVSGQASNILDIYNTSAVLNSVISSAGNLGIGTTTPWAPISVSSIAQQVGTSPLLAVGSTTGASIFDILANGKVGLGTTSPAQLLSVSGNGYFTGGLGIGVATTSAGTLQTSASAIIGTTLGVGTTSPVANLSIESLAQGTGTVPVFAIASTTNATLFTVLGNGNVGAGTTTPYAQLSLASSIITTPTFALSPIANQTGDIQDIYTTAGKLTDVITAVNTFGIGTTTPWATLSVSTTTQNISSMPLFAVASTTNVTLFDVLGGGNVGIGTSSPVQLLSVGGNGYFTGGLGIGVATTSAGNLQTSGSAVIGTTLGVGTTTPWGKLSVEATAQGTGTLPIFTVASTTNLTLFDVLGNGNVGIGTTSPYASLSVTGSSDLGNSALAGFFIATSTASSTFGGPLSSASGNFIIGSAGTTNNLLLNPYGGSVGIGTSAPSTTFSVVGNSYITGRLGVGILNPSSGLEVNGNITIAPGSGGQLVFADGSSMFTAGAAGTGITSWNNLNFQTGGVINFLTGNGVSTTTDLVLTNNGYFGVGTTSPWATLSVSTTTQSTGVLPLFLVASTTNAQLFDVFGNGRVGIGSSTPLANLSIVSAGSNVWSSTTPLFQLSTTTGPAFFSIMSDGQVGIGTSSPEGTSTLVVAGSLCVSKGVAGLSGAKSVSTTVGCPNVPGTIYADVALNVNAGYDIAENYPSADTSLETGDVVMTDPNNPVYVQKAVNNGTGTVIGVISTNPAISFDGIPTDLPAPGYALVALAGRVPVKVSVANGPINIGDYLTMSNIPGVAVKATQSTTTIGIALAPATSDGTTTVFIEPGWEKIGVDATVGNSWTDSIGTSTLPQEFSILQGIQAGYLSLQKLTVNEIAGVVASFSHVTTNTIKVNTGIEMVDQVTGLSYCVTVSNGDFVKTVGSCDSDTSTSTPNSSPNPAPASPSIPSSPTTPTPPVGSTTPSTPSTPVASTTPTTPTAPPATSTPPVATPPVPSAPPAQSTSTDSTPPTDTSSPATPTTPSSSTDTSDSGSTDASSAAAPSTTPAPAPAPSTPSDGSTSGQ